MLPMLLVKLANYSSTYPSRCSFFPDSSCNCVYLSSSRLLVSWCFSFISSNCFEKSDNCTICSLALSTTPLKQISVSHVRVFQVSRISVLLIGFSLMRTLMSVQAVSTRLYINPSQPHRRILHMFSNRRRGESGGCHCSGWRDWVC